MTTAGTRKEGPTRWAGVWRLALLCGLVLAATGLASVPAAGLGRGVAEESAELSDVDQDEWRALHEAYGMSGCTVVEGFNDRCPEMVSWPYQDPMGGWATPSKVIVSPDGATVYNFGLQADGHRTWPANTVDTYVVAYHARGFDEGRIKWSTRIGGSADEYLNTRPRDMELSADGRRLYLTVSAKVNDPAGGDSSTQQGSVVALDTGTGNVLWRVAASDLMDRVDTAPGSRGETLWDVTVDPTGKRVYVELGVSNARNPGVNFTTDAAGETVTAPGKDEIAHYVALDASTGDRVWSTLYDSYNPSWVNGLGTEHSLVVSPDGKRLFAQVVLTYPDGDNEVGYAMVSGFVTVAFDAASGDLLWEQAYIYPEEDGMQNVPSGMTVSPAGDKVFVFADHATDDLTQDLVRGKLLVLAYDASDGRQVWSKKYEGTDGTGCAENFVFTSADSAIGMSPSGDLLYLVSSAAYAHEGGSCIWDDSVTIAHDVPDGMKTIRRGTAIVAVDAATGIKEWGAFVGRDRGISCRDQCDVHVAPGPAGGDAGSQVVVVTNYRPEDWINNNNNFLKQYPWTFSLDGATGDLLWQGRYLDTFNDEGNQSAWSEVGDSDMSPDGARLYRSARKNGATSEDDVVSIVGYSLRRDLPDLIPSTLGVSQEKPRKPAVLTASVVNSGQAPAPAVVVAFYVGDTLIGQTAPVDIASGETTDVSVSWDVPRTTGQHDITAVVDPGNSVVESDEANNSITRTVTIRHGTIQ